MRFGQLLAEESPLALLSTYRCTNLEEIFLKLSTKQEITNNSVNQLNISNLPHSASVPTLPSGNKKDALVYASQDSGVEGLSFYRRKEVLANDRFVTFWINFVRGHSLIILRYDVVLVDILL